MAHEAAKQQGDLDIASIVAVALIGALIVVLVIVGVEAYFFKAQEAAYAAAYATPDLEIAKVKVEQQGLLNAYLVPESGKGTLHIPIDRAIELTVRDGAAGPAPVPVATAPAPPAAGPQAAAAAKAAPTAKAAPGAKGRKAPGKP
jgi:hypothetical protein